MLQTIMNYMVPAAVLPKLNGKELWRNNWFLVLGELVGLIPRAT